MNPFYSHKIVHISYIARYDIFNIYFLQIEFDQNELQNAFQFRKLIDLKEIVVDGIDERNILIEWQLNDTIDYCNWVIIDWWIQ